jgi:hypothetical protein
MSGGTISSNTASSTAGLITVSASGGGVFVDNGTFTMNGGTISGNATTSTTSNSHGGGVFVNNNGTFNKTGGTITGYASDTVNGNRASASSGGHAVYVYINANNVKRRETTAGPEINMDSSVNGTTGGWEN